MQAQPLLPDPAPRIYAGLFVVAFATLMFEILLTRIFSVTPWHLLAAAALLRERTAVHAVNQVA